MIGYIDVGAPSVISPPSISKLVKEKQENTNKRDTHEGSVIVDGVGNASTRI